MGIVVDFKKIVSELESKKIKLCFLKDRGLFIEDDHKNLYQMETYRQGSYLDMLIKDEVVVEFHQVENSLSNNVGDWEKEIWGVSEVESFIKRQSLLTHVVQEGVVNMLGKYEANMVEGKDGWVLSPSFLKLIQDRLSHMEEVPQLETIEVVLLAFDEIRDK